jgi:hypothetical protein
MMNMKNFQIPLSIAQRLNSPSNALASCKSFVSKPSVNHTRTASDHNAALRFFHIPNVAAMQWRGGLALQAALSPIATG